MGVRSFIAANAVAILGAVSVVAIGFAAVEAVQLHGFKIGPVSVEGALAKATRLEAEADSLTALAAATSALRQQEQAQNKASYASQAGACDQRVSVARDAGRIISEVTAVDAKANNVVSGGIIGADSLRGIIGQGGGSQAAGVPAGTDSARASGTEVAR